MLSLKIRSTFFWQRVSIHNKKEILWNTTSLDYTLGMLNISKQKRTMAISIQNNSFWILAKPSSLVYPKTIILGSNNIIILDNASCLIILAFNKCHGNEFFWEILKSKSKFGKQYFEHVTFVFYLVYRLSKLIIWTIFKLY